MDLVSQDALAVIALRLEADIEPFEGKVAVAEVIRNRMRFKYQSDGTIAGTIFAPAQFSSLNTKHPLRGRLFRLQAEDPKTAEAILAWETSARSNTVGKAVLYFSPEAMVPVGSRPPWIDAARYVRQVGRHLFYEDPAIDKEG